MAEDGQNGNGNGDGTWGKVLTPQQRLFIDHWFATNCNGTEASRLAGYCEGGDERAWAANGSRLLRNVKVQEEIRRRWAAHGFTGEEGIARLADQARASIEDFIDIIEPGRVMVLNLEKARQRGKLHLIKKLYWTEQGPRLELHDAQAAIALITKFLMIEGDGDRVINILVDF